MINRSQELSELNGPIKMLQTANQRECKVACRLETRDGESSIGITDPRDRKHNRLISRQFETNTVQIRGIDSIRMLF